ncbi:MAG: hypothetical protein IE881_09235 [Epsilonproteobacteria bacterium]|nr:hypothetical protein [Campylobacterota bacterium]
MSPFSKSYKLKQHTPMIHFQSDQSGATLRATELKPKLDRFLIANCADIPYKKHPNGDKSLDYKVSIRATGVTVEDIEKKDHRGKEQKDPLFFGNMGEWGRKKFVNAKTLEIEFVMFNSEIKKAIEDNFEAFLAQTNFGTRQSKGFGSFYLDKPFNNSLIPHKVYSFRSNNWKSDIKLFYSFLRAGINTANFGGIYAKAAIFSYAQSQGWSWDKKAIKAKYLSKEKIEDGKYTLVRDLFGLSSEQSWMSYNATISKETKGIDRFKSPITFKIVDNTVYFWADKSAEVMLNRLFTIKYNKIGDLKLSTPTQFSFDDFFEYTFKLDISSYIEPKFHNDKFGEFNTLKRIFTEIKAGK